MLSLVVEPISLLGRNTLIIGEVGSGKTRLTAKIIDSWLRHGLGDSITVLDFAPRYGGVGRGLDEYIDVGSIRYLTSNSFKAPRLSARDRDELEKYVENNYLLATKLIEKYVGDPTPILVINDLSIYLHKGNPSILSRVIREARTFLGNSYYGSSISSGFSAELDMIERRRVEELFPVVDVLIVL